MDNCALDSFEYRGFWIGPKVALKDRRNPISGHQWTEMNVVAGIHISASERRPMLLRLASNLRSVEAAKREVDAVIQLTFLSECERFKANAQPHAAPYFHAYWSKVVELAHAAGLSRPTDDILESAECELHPKDSPCQESPRP